MFRKLFRLLMRRAKRLLPVFFLRKYRLGRKLVRHIFRHLIDRKKRRKYTDLIFSKYPDLKVGRHSGLVLDLGANLGHFSDACKEIGYSIVCVEPHPDAIDYLEKRFRHHSEIEIVKKAITYRGTPTQLQFHPDHDNDPLTTSLSATIISEKFEAVHKSVTVPGATLENFFAHNERYEIVKIDIEGAEIFLIEDLIRFAPRIKRLLLETHSRYMNNSKDGEDYILKLALLHNFISENKLEDVWFTDWV